MKWDMKFNYQSYLFINHHLNGEVIIMLIFSSDGSTCRHANNERGWFYFLFTKFDKLNCQRREEEVNKKYNPEKLLSLLSFLNIRSLGKEHPHQPPLDIWFTFPPSHMEGSFFTIIVFPCSSSSRVFLGRPFSAPPLPDLMKEQHPATMWLNQQIFGIPSNVIQSILALLGNPI